MNETMAWLKTDRILMDAFKSCMTDDECPVCSILNKALTQDADILLGAVRHDRALRKKINVNGGFCKKHGGLMARSGSSGARSIYKEALESAIQSMGTSRVVLLKTDRAYGPHGFQKGCVFCEALSAYEPLLVRAFIEFYHRDNRFSAQYEQGGMLCLPHLHMASGQSLRYLESGARLYRGTVIKYQRLLEGLSETRQEDEKLIAKVAEMLSGAEI